ncbi:hypothetical protein CCOS865_04377 [Pseudomonas reidholzensis]|uniref:Uncharacterized protein n=1 Tax=Pseudomonas reidholzensis TaxID=1785162 RepID=A0A383RYG6_9PSED|nr:hypothetical protein [Pseudomonas reidholzensis]SYX92092.1 hypothetical protein CCOS865_04377 [Pseudomonas reidholzensis]
MRLVPITLVALLSSVALSTMAAPTSITEANRLFDQMDREEMLADLESASHCVGQRNFSCAEAHLKAARELINTDADQTVWNRVVADYNSERQFVEDEAQAEREQARLERQQERDEEEAAARREERLEAKRNEAYAFGSAFIGLQTHLSAEQRAQMIEAYVADTMAGQGANNVRRVGNQMQSDMQAQLEDKRQRHEAHAERQRERAEQTRQAIEQQRAARTEAAHSRTQTALAAAQSQQGAGAEPSTAKQAAALEQSKARQKQLEEAQAQKLARQQAADDAAEQAREQAAAVAKAKAAEARAAQKLAKQQEEDRAKQDYLRQTTKQTKLAAITCFGPHYYVVGIRPRIKPELHSCVDVSFRASCPGGGTSAQGVISNFLGASTDCFMGDTVEMEKLDCPAKEVQVQALETRPCGGFK